MRKKLSKSDGTLQTLFVKLEKEKIFESSNSDNFIKSMKKSYFKTGIWSFDNIFPKNLILLR